MRRRLLVCACFTALAMGTSAIAAPAGYADVLSGRLQHIKATATVRLGFRENSIPFSYRGPDGQPLGYSIDLCAAIVDTIASEIDEPALRVEYVRVTAEDRVDKMVAGVIDLECGSTTSTAERRSRVAFSPVIFVTGTRLAVPSASRLHSVNDMHGGRLAVVAGTTNEAAMRQVDRLRGLALQLVEARDYRDAVALVEQGRADAVAADEVLLRGVLAEIGAADRFRLVGEMLSLEPYAIMYPRDDPALAQAVDLAFRTLAEKREIAWTYERWFMRPLPSGPNLRLPMSDALRRSLELIGLPPD